MNDLLALNSADEVKKITSFLAKTFREQGLRNAVIGVSGGIDSSTSLALLASSISKKNIVPVHLPYFESDDDLESVLKAVGVSTRQLITISIEDIVDSICDELEVPEENLLRRGNIMARVRMVILYDIAKVTNGAVVGTENRSEYYLGYYTRHGDEASDIEPLRHLYKTQVYILAKYLNLPSKIIGKKPSAGLWENQTDESEFGFTYKEADPVLFLHFDKNKTESEIEKLGYKNTKKIINFAEKNFHKRKVPYVLT